MKFNKTVAAAAVASLFSAGAFAQSSVTLYGSLDAGIGYVNKIGGESLWAQTSGALSNTYFGLRGSEDLGGGNRAIFKLESGFNIGSGQFGGWLSGNQGLFNRQAYVGLSNAAYGTLTLGRQYDSVVDYLGPISLSGNGVNLAAHPFNNDNINGQYAISNSVKYESADYAGFHFGGMYGFSNSSDFASGRQWSAGAAYSNGPFKLAAAYNQLNNNGFAGGALNSTGSLDGDVLAADVQRTFGVGANYTYGPATAGLLWTRTKLQGAGAVAGRGIDGARFDNIEANVVYGLTPAVALVASYTFTYANINDTALRYHSATLGADYSLSKRTDIYLAGVYQHATGDSSTGYAGYGGTNIAGMLPASSTQNQVGVVSGLRVKF
jgi:predicted porin